MMNQAPNPQWRGSYKHIFNLLEQETWKEVTIKQDIGHKCK